MSDMETSVEYTVQIGVFRSQDAAKSVANPLEYLGYPVRVENFNNLYYVFVGAFSVLEEATNLEGDLKALGYNTLIKEIQIEELPGV